jgi:hypothetical protein
MLFQWKCSSRAKSRAQFTPVRTTAADSRTKIVITLDTLSRPNTLFDKQTVFIDNSKNKEYSRWLDAQNVPGNNHSYEFQIFLTYLLTYFQSRPLDAIIYILLFSIPADRGYRLRQGDSRSKAKFPLLSYSPSREGISERRWELREREIDEICRRRFGWFYGGKGR